MYRPFSAKLLLLSGLLLHFPLRSPSLSTHPFFINILMTCPSKAVALSFFSHLSLSVHHLPLSCFSSIPLHRFHPPCDGLVFMVGLSPVHDSIYFGSLLFLISFITTALFPSALYLLGAVLCPTHLNPLLSHVSVLCEVKEKKKKHPFSSSVVFFLEFHCNSEGYIPGTWAVGCFLANGSQFHKSV